MLEISTSPDPRRALFWTQDPSLPSFRHRLSTHIPALSAAGFECQVETFPRRRYVQRILERWGSVTRADLLVIAKLKLEWIERALLRQAGCRIVYDVDDAVYFRKPHRSGEPVDRSRWRFAKFLQTCRIADLVVAGNEVVADVARRSAPRVEVIPTALDPEAYPIRRAEGPGLRLAWIGLAENLSYLRLLEWPLLRLAREFPGLELVVISSRPPESFPIPVRFVEWSSATEAAALAAADIGVMPLDDDDWCRGKGGFKLIQYMAAGLPALASPVGMNQDIVLDGVTGYLPRNEGEWEYLLRRLIRDENLRREMGRSGRRRVEMRYNARSTGERVVELFGALAGAVHTGAVHTGAVHTGVSPRRVLEPLADRPAALPSRHRPTHSRSPAPGGRAAG